MLTRLPLVYEVTLPRGNGTTKRLVVESVEFEVVELELGDLSEAFVVRHQWVNSPYYRPDALARAKEVLKIDGGFLYAFNPGSRLDFAASDIPRAAGTPRGQAMTFIEAMLEQDNPRLLAARAALGVDSGADIRNLMPPPPETVISSDRERRFARLQELVRRVVVADGRVWWRVTRPLMALRFHQKDISADIHLAGRHEHPPWCSQGHVLVPITAAWALPRAAEIMGLDCNLELSIENTGGIDQGEIAFDAEEWMLEREIMDAVTGARRHAGQLSVEGLAAWMALRDRVSGDLDRAFGREFESTFERLIDALAEKQLNYKRVAWRARFLDILAGLSTDHGVSGALLKR